MYAAKRFSKKTASQAYKTLAALGFLAALLLPASHSTAQLAGEPNPNIPAPFFELGVLRDSDHEALQTHGSIAGSSVTIRAFDDARDVSFTEGDDFTDAPESVTIGLTLTVPGESTGDIPSPYGPIDWALIEVAIEERSDGYEGQRRYGGDAANINADYVLYSSVGIRPPSTSAKLKPT